MPFVGAIVIAQETIQQDTDARGRPHTSPRTIEFDVLADKRTLRPLAYRYANGAIQHIADSSERSNPVVTEVVWVPRRPASEPGAKSSTKTLQRFTVEPTRQTVIDDDGTERVVVGRRPRGY